MEGDGVVAQAFRDSGTISIHSLRMEGDTAGSQGRAGPTNFNPLPPHGGRPAIFIIPF